MVRFHEPFRLGLSNQSVVAEHELSHERMLLRDEGHCLRGQALVVRGNPPHDQETPDDDFRATGLEIICMTVAAGLGCTLLPAIALPSLTARNE